MPHPTSSWNVCEKPHRMLRKSYLRVCKVLRHIIYIFELQLWSHVVCLSLEEMVSHCLPTMRNNISGHPYFTASSAALPQNMECSFASHCKACRLKRFVSGWTSDLVENDLTEMVICFIRFFFLKKHITVRRCKTNIHSLWYSIVRMTYVW